MDVDLAPVAGEEIDLTVTVWGSPGVEPTALTPIRVRRESGAALGRPVVGRLDLPADGEVVSGDVLEVKGWCLFEGTHVARVEIVVDGARKGLARPYVDRSDIAGRYDHADAPLAGFDALLSFEYGDRPTTSLVTVEVTSLDGQRWQSPTHRVHWSGSPPADVDEDAHHARRRAAMLDGVAGGGHRVVVFTHDFYYGGGQLWLLELLRQIARSSELEVMVVSMGDGPLRGELEHLGCTVHVTAPCRVDDVHAYDDKVNELAVLMRSWGAGAVLVNTLGVFAAVDAAARAGVPAVWAIHESFEPATYRRICWGATVMHAQVADRFVACFRSVRALVFEARQTADLFAHLCVPEQRFVVDYGVDVDEIDAYRGSVDRVALRHLAGFDDDDVVLLVLGVFEPRKAQGAMAAAFDVLASVHHDLRLVLVGSWPTPYDKAVRARVHGSAAADRVDIWPIMPDVHPWYALADVFVCASDIESLPRSILEAMAFELPVVSTDVFGISDLITDGQNGWLTRDRDLEGLIGLLHQVLRLPAEERRAVGARAREEVAKRHGEQRYGRVFARVLENLVEDPLCDLAPAFSRFDHDAARATEVQGGPRDNG